MLNVTTAERLALIYKNGEHSNATDGLYRLRGIINNEFELLPFTVRLERDELSYDELKAQWDVELLPVSDLNNDSPIFDKVTNVRLRAVHDYHHAVTDSDFSLSGEIATYNHFMSSIKNDYLIDIYNHVISKILFSEIVLQAAYFHHFGVFADTQKLVLSSAFCTYLKA